MFMLPGTVALAAALVAASTTAPPKSGAFDAVNLIYIALGALASFILIFGAFRGGFQSSVSSAMRKEMASPQFKESLTSSMRDAVDSQLEPYKREMTHTTDDLYSKFGRVTERTARIEGRIGIYGNGGTNGNGGH